MAIFWESISAYSDHDSPNILNRVIQGEILTTPDIKYLKAFSEMREDDFTKSVLKPLFEAMGYERVDFNGGPLERGRDLIAQILIPPNRDPRVVYVQTKKLGDIQNTTESAKFTKLIHQLRQCLDQTVTTIDGKELVADEVYLACPEQISNRFLDEIKGQLFGGRSRQLGVQVELMDGPRILECVKRYSPEILKTIFGVNHELFLRDNDDLVNRELLDALKTKKNLSVDSFYSDLNFFVGSIDSNILLHLVPVVESSELLLSDVEWEVVKRQILSIEKKYKVGVAKLSISEIEGDYNKKLNKYKSKSNLDLIEKFNSERSSLKHDEEFLRNEAKNLLHLIDGAIGSTEGCGSRIKIKSPLTDGVGDDVLIERAGLVRKLISEIDEKTYASEWFNGFSVDPIFHPKLQYLVRKLRDCECSARLAINLERRISPPPKYTLVLDECAIVGAVKKLADSYVQSVLKINEGKTDVRGLRKFLRDTSKTLSFVRDISDQNMPLSKVVKFSHQKTQEDRVSISPHNIFSTGIDVAVYGGAGVGKTTTLQAYVSFSDDEERSDILYVPLNRLVERYRRENADGSNKALRDNLVQGLVLVSKGLEPSIENVERLNVLLGGRVAIILDGLDEVYNVIPNLLAGIREFKEKYPQVQLIVSSRDCVSYLSSIDFLGITLLPFTPGQLDRFISGWLGDKDKADSLVEAIHKRHLYEHIKTPLLATITCSLIERGVDAPSSEFDIYSERVRLLVGEYDKSKNVVRQNQTADLLKQCAVKIAYAMHRQKIRATSKRNLFKLLRHEMSSAYSDALLESCIDELENPCNIIVCDKLSEEYGFGHFRFQEHLAACELSKNRDADLAELAIQDWWRGALCLYAQVNVFFDIFEGVHDRYGSIDSAAITLEAMIDSAPIERRHDLTKAFRRYLELGGLEESLDEYGYHDYDGLSWN